MRSEYSFEVIVATIDVLGDNRLEKLFGVGGVFLASGFEDNFEVSLVG